MVLNGIEKKPDGSLNIIEKVLEGKESRTLYFNSGTKNKQMLGEDIIAKMKEFYNDNIPNPTCSDNNVIFKTIIEEVQNGICTKKKCKEDINTIYNNIVHMCWLKKPTSKPDLTPNGIMIHEPGDGSDDIPLNTMKTLKGTDPKTTKLSVHFIIDGDTGYIYSCYPLNYRAAHCGGCNQTYGGTTTGQCCREDKKTGKIIPVCKLYGKTVDFKIDKKLEEKGEDAKSVLIKNYPEQEANIIPDNNDATIFHIKNFGLKGGGCAILAQEKNFKLYRENYSFNHDKISIEICRGSSKTNYEKIVIPAAIELCAWLCYIYMFKPTEREDIDKSFVSMETNYQGYDQFNSNFGNNKYDLEKGIPKYLITHREGHIFYHKASNHEDPDSYWFSTKLEKSERKKLANLVKLNKQTEYNDSVKNNSVEKIIVTGSMINKLEITTIPSFLNKQLTPNYFRELVKLKLDQITALGVNKKDVIEEYCNPVLRLLIPDGII
ncbi:N-acetylmuramoyl-L-alanine amidase [Ruminococcus sp.]|uniref:N-acetylmuramoyl-L-alanine amidase n=1 Tax=Ruminococcus sp. TaxID=41978 RepID=UPI0025D79790|nr:N-acetylmuramoyl-L-alanine amidase [Ruminococcus sp.]